MADYARIMKFNPNHDPKNGEFTSGKGSGSAWSHAMEKRDAGLVAAGDQKNKAAFVQREYQKTVQGLNKEQAKANVEGLSQWEKDKAAARAILAKPDKYAAATSGKAIHADIRPYGAFHAEDHGANVAAIYFQSSRMKTPQRIATAQVNNPESIKARISDHIERNGLGQKGKAKPKDWLGILTKP